MAGCALPTAEQWGTKPQISRHRTFARFLGNIISSPALLPRQLTVRKIISTAENKQKCSFYMRCCTSIEWIVFGFQQHCILKRNNVYSFGNHVRVNFKKTRGDEPLPPWRAHSTQVGRYTGDKILHQPFTSISMYKLKVANWMERQNFIWFTLLPNRDPRQRMQCNHSAAHWCKRACVPCYCCCQCSGGGLEEF